MFLVFTMLIRLLEVFLYCFAYLSLNSSNSQSVFSLVETVSHNRTTPKRKKAIQTGETLLK